MVGSLSLIHAIDSSKFNIYALSSLCSLNLSLLTLNLYWFHHLLWNMCSWISDDEFHLWASISSWATTPNGSWRLANRAFAWFPSKDCQWDVSASLKLLMYLFWPQLFIPYWHLCTIYAKTTSCASTICWIMWYITFIHLIVCFRFIIFILLLSLPPSPKVIPFF